MNGVRVTLVLFVLVFGHEARATGTPVEPRCYWGTEGSVAAACLDQGRAGVLARLDQRAGNRAPTEPPERRRDDPQRKLDAVRALYESLGRQAPHARRHAILQSSVSDGEEGIADTLYSWQIGPRFWLGANYERCHDPADLSERGGVSVYTLRAQTDF